MFEQVVQSFVDGDVSNQEQGVGINAELDIQKRRKSYDVLDLSKFIFAIFVVAIHTQLFPDVLFPWLRIAVPMFFIISSFLFFINTSKLDVKAQNKALWKFLKRNLILYATWSIIQLPFTIYINRNVAFSGVLDAIWFIIKTIFISGAFFASWFLIANMLAVVIVFFMSKKMNVYIILVIGALLNVLCCFSAGYEEVMPIVAEFNSLVNSFIGSIVSSFIVALFWVALGKAFADGKIKINICFAIVGFIVSATLLYVEWKLTYIYLNLGKSRDCLFLLMPTCLFLFSLLYKCDTVKIKGNKFFRASSTLTYCTHYIVSILIGKLFFLAEIYSIALKFLLTLIVCSLMSFLILYLSNKKKLRFLKYLY